MKKRRLFILIYALLICLALVGCGKSKDSGSETKTETESEPQVIKASVITKYTGKEIVVFSDTTCFFYLNVSICDGETKSQNSYGEFQISEGENITLTIEDLAPGFFSDRAIITDVNAINNPYVYEKSSLARDDYRDIDCSLLMKYSSKEITIYSDTSCFFDLYISTKDINFESTNYYHRLEIKEGETITLTLEDLVPGFFSDNTSIRYVNPYIDTYVKK